MITLDQAITEAQKNGRICLQPKKWNELYNLLPERRRKGREWEPALPLILAAWRDTPVLLKATRFREHLAWADAHGALAEVFEFITNLKEEDWYHGE